MPLRILSLPPVFQPSTSIVYPPFKHGRYLEEYALEYFTEHQDSIETEYVYLPVLWTNVQNHVAFTRQKQSLILLLQRAMQAMPVNTLFFTVVQHDDGPFLPLPKTTLVFGACTGSVPLPLIYEDTTTHLLHQSRLANKEYLASFVGTLTHPVRKRMVEHLQTKANVAIHTKPHEEWTNHVPASAADTFVDLTLRSKFCLAPRGYGRSSFRFFEAMLLDTVPVYLWDDKEWLPYKEIIDYSECAVSIQEKDIPKLYNILESISEETYQHMVEAIRRNRHMFTLSSMCEYIVMRITRPSTTLTGPLPLLHGRCA